MCDVVDSLEVRRRVSRLRALMEEEGVGSLFVSSPKNVLYLTGREVGRVLFTRRGCFLWTKDLYLKLYSGLYQSRGYPFDVRVFERGVIKDFVRRLGVKKLFVDDVCYSGFLGLRREFGVKLAFTDLVERCRSVKTPLEVEFIRRSCRIAVKGMRRAYEVVQSGVCEMDAVSEIEYVIRRSGSDSPPFEDGMLLSSGRRSADVHARPRNNLIKLGTTVVVDLGARYNGYYSDMTRTIKVGEVSKKTSELLEFVDGLRAEAIDMLKPGIVAGEIHDFVEKKIKAKGYKFYHGCGHGVGLNIHESPSLSRDSKEVLKENMVFTVEPGIYIPNRFGVRFEDTVLLKKNKAEVLTKD